MNSKKNNITVSVILVNWNGLKWINKCLKTLSNQDCPNFEIIVVDNASHDKSLWYIRKYFPNVKIYENKENLGLAKAVSIGIRKSLGRYILLINTDTWVERNFISSLKKFYKANDYSVISPVVKNYDKGKQVVNQPNIDPTGSPAYFYPMGRADKLLYLSSCYFCEKSVYKKTLGFDDDYFAYYEDVDWFWRMNLMNMKFAYADNIFVYHAGAGAIGKGIKYKMFLWRNQNALQTLLKNYSLISLMVFLPIYFFQNVIEIIFFLLVLKPNIAYTYFQGWLFNFTRLPNILKKRRWVQKHRKVSDWQIIKKMYLGPAKLRMLFSYIH